jgi:hypothetical protein
MAIANYAATSYGSSITRDSAHQITQNCHQTRSLEAECASMDSTPQTFTPAMPSVSSGHLPEQIVARPPRGSAGGERLLRQAVAGAYIQHRDSEVLERNRSADTPVVDQVDPMLLLQSHEPVDPQFGHLASLDKLDHPTAAKIRNSREPGFKDMMDALNSGQEEKPAPEPPKRRCRRRATKKDQNASAPSTAARASRQFTEARLILPAPTSQDADGSGLGAE